MTTYAAQLRAIRRTLNHHDAHLCRLGNSDEWVALGLPLSPTLRYRQGRWVGSNERLQRLINQALGDLRHENLVRRSAPQHRRFSRTNRK